MSVVGRAYVTVRAVTKQVEGDIQKGVDKALDNVEKKSSSSSSSSSGSSIGQSLGKSIGDGVMCMFPNPADALRAGVDMQIAQTDREDACGAPAPSGRRPYPRRSTGPE